MSTEPVNPIQLDISQEQAPLLLKNALHLTADQNNIIYKPYSIFGEQLSHISEEDASQLDRMFTEESLRPVASYQSVDAVSFQSESVYRYEENTIVPCHALALLPLPTPLDPLVGIYIKDSPEQELIYPAMPKANIWKTSTLSLTLLLLGMGHGLINPFLFVYVHEILEISFNMISCLIMAHFLSHMLMSFVIEKWFFHRFKLTLITTSVHITLILCSILYPCFKSNHLTTWAGLLVLQALQVCAFQLIWSSAADQAHLMHWNQMDRMKQRATISALYTSIGPALGVLIAGCILQSEKRSEDYILMYKICVALFSLSFVISWGWTSDE
ncbi:uncharacterized protein B0P05DRAFT_462967 [Gilbertella persicaria]|nr:uncharacterized protein B0P05DRAFT_462967 [Gilbertella persicaria]KAI8091487.1 hypothetical protein B0P05DRAFT_462967 [Gilbertella persicaria]